MRGYKRYSLTSEISDLLLNESVKVVIGVLGKSTNFEASKLTNLNVLKTINDKRTLRKTNREGDISIYIDESSDVLYVHFKTSFDEEILLSQLEQCEFDHFTDFHSDLRTKFGHHLLLAMQMCHIVLIVEPEPTFDASYLSLFKSLKIIREKHLQRLIAKIMKTSTVAQYFGKDGRLCAPRVLWSFESQLQEYETEMEKIAVEDELEEHIYKLLRNEHIITNNAALSLFSIPRHKKFLFISDARNETPEPLEASFKLLFKLIDGVTISKPKLPNVKRERSLIKMIQGHVDEALGSGFDDSSSKWKKDKFHFALPPVKAWFEAFRLLHEIFIERLDVDADHAGIIANFEEIIDIDKRFFEDACRQGYEFGLFAYNDGLPHHYSTVCHEQRKVEALLVFANYARGASMDSYQEKLIEMCDTIWVNGRQQCEELSLRGNPCILKKYDANEHAHNSGVIYISACNCGKIQGNRADPYTVIQANYEFYQTLGLNCPNCPKVEKYRFPIFEPSINNFKAAHVSNPGMDFSERSETPELSQKTQSLENLSFQEDNVSEEQEKVKRDADDGDASSADSDNCQIVIKIGETTEKEEVSRHVSTTEYLASMIQMTSPEGLLPQFSSFSLVCIGSSSIYSHNTGLPETTQSGFLSGSNFLLPWEVNVRLEHAQSWAQNYESRNRNRRRHGSAPTKDGMNFNLKIFLGCEYECARGHRYMLSSPTEIMKTGTVQRDCGSKVVTSDMPLYFPCICRNNVGQLMRVHVVTPKAPVNVIIEPKIRPGSKNFACIFTTGVSEPIKLSQSAYWILRLPCIYQSEDGTMPPPRDVTAENAANYGCLMGGMYGIKESESEM